MVVPPPPPYHPPLKNLLLLHLFLLLEAGPSKLRLEDADLRAGVPELPAKVIDLPAEGRRLMDRPGQPLLELPDRLRGEARRQRQRRRRQGRERRWYPAS